MLPKGFVYLDDIDDSIAYDIKYSSNDNLVGRSINGYHDNVVIITERAAKLLSDIQKDLRSKNLGIKIFDAYRPHSACQDFKQWALDLSDQRYKNDYYPNVAKKDIMHGYIADFSTHSRGSTVDLTLINLDSGEQLLMGTCFDYLDELSHTDNKDIEEQAFTNRQFLKQIMYKYNFNNYWREWWHFQLENELFTKNPQEHFNFPVLAKKKI